jgi:hypothetical protein
MECKILFRIFLSWHVYKNLETKKYGFLKIPKNWIRTPESDNLMNENLPF